MDVLEKQWWYDFPQESGLFANNGMLSFATGDLNHDGFVDVYSSYGDIYTNPSNFEDQLTWIQKIQIILSHLICMA